MTPLTLAEVAELEKLRADFVREVLTSTELTPEASRIARSYRAQLDAALPALLAAAKRLADIESAMVFVRHHPEVCNRDDQNMTPDGIVGWAKRLGWTPPSEAK